ncbi:MAG: magnesium transporter [Christensenellaceae bacterium]|nr:magnesium transporter [Christensenellaceae bacterium]
MAVFSTDLSSTIETLLENKRYNSVRDILVTVNAADIAIILADQPANRLIRLFRLLPKELASDVFVEMDSDLQEQLINSFSDKELGELVNELYMDDAVDLIEEMPANVVKRILSQADPETRRQINELLKYPEDSAGSLMTTEFADLTPHMTAEEALGHIRLTGIDKKTIDVCYVVEKRKLIGLISLRTLVLADSGSLVSDLMDENVISAGTLDDIEEAAGMFAKYGLTSLPVVDGESRLVGIITVDDAIDVIRDEATEDIEKMSAITPSDKPYPRLGVFELYKNRIPWLLLMMISSVFTQMIIGRFEAALAAQIVLASFIPMLMDTGGNSGSQASVTIIRSLSLNEIGFSDIFRIIWKELRIATLCGLSLAAVNFAKLMLLDRVGLMIAVTVSVTLAAAVIIAKFFGCTLPLLVKKIGLDPAVMASPMITTIVDAISLIIYFGIATLMLNI